MNAVDPTVPPMDPSLLSRLWRFTVIDKVALGFAAVFLLGFAAFALLAGVAIGDAPEGRLWNFLLSRSAIGFGVGIVAPWALCRSMHATGHAARFSWNRRAERARAAQPPAVRVERRAA